MEFKMLLAVYITLFICFQGSMDAVMIDIHPSEWTSKLQTKVVHITCCPEFEQGDFSDVILFELSKKGEGPLVFLKDSTHVAYENDLSGRLKAVGQITKTSGQMNFSVAIHNPTSQDEGEYTCSALTIDGEGNSMRTFSSTWLTVEKSNVTNPENVSASLHDRLATLEEHYRTRVALLENKILRMEAKHATGLHDKIRSMMNDTTDLRDKISSIEDKQGELMTTIEENRQYLSNNLTGLQEQEKRMAVLEENLERHLIAIIESDASTEASMATFRKDTSRKLEDLTNQSKQLQDLSKKVGHTVVFSAYNYNTITVWNGRTLPFTSILIQRGPGYNRETGVFTAPVHGMYVFHLVIAEAKNNDLDVYLKVNLYNKAQLSTGDNDYYDQSATNAVVELKPGDKVYCVSYCDKCRIIGGVRSTFSGYLIQAL